MTQLQLDQIEARRERMSWIDIWMDGDEHGDEIRADLDALIEVCRQTMRPGRFRSAVPVGPQTEQSRADPVPTATPPGNAPTRASGDSL